MAETVQRRVDIQITGSDNGASAALSGVGKAAQQMANQVKSASVGGGGGGDTGMVFGPAVRSRFDADTQLVRDKIAGRIRAMRDSAKRAAQEERINDYLFGAPQKAGLPDLTAADFNRGVSKYRAPINVGRSDSALKRLGQEGEQLNKLSAMARGGGALMILSVLTDHLNKINPVLDKWEENSRVGVSTSENLGQAMADLIPVAGDLGKAIRTNILDRMSGEYQAERERKRKEAEKKELEDMKNKRDEARKPIIDAAAEGAVEARFRLRTAGLTGDKLGRAQAGVDLDKELREIEQQRAKVRTFGDEQRLKSEADLNTREAAARAEYLAKIQAMDEESNKKTIEDSRKKAEWETQSQDMIRQKAAEGRQLDLENQGRYLTAKLEGVKAAADEELAQLKKKHDEETKALEADPVSGRQASSVRDNAQRRMKAEEDAVRANQKRQEKAIRDEDQREREQAAEEHGRRMLDSQVDLTSRRLSLEGRDQEAEQLRLRRTYQKRLEEIKTNLDDQVRAHKEREPELRAQAKEAASAAAEDFALSQEEMARRREAAFKVGLPGGVAADSPLKGLIGPLGLAGGAGSPADRTAKASEKTNVQLEKVNKTLERVEKALTGLGPVGVVSGN